MNLKKLNKFGDGYYIFTDGSNRTNKQYFTKDGNGNIII